MKDQEIKVGMEVMTPNGKGIVVRWSCLYNLPFLVKLENYSRHNAPNTNPVCGSKESLWNDGKWFSSGDLIPIERSISNRLVPFKDEFDWCEEGVLVHVEGCGDRYAVRAKPSYIWVVGDGKKLCEINYAQQLVTWPRHLCQKIIPEPNRLLTNFEFFQFVKEYTGTVYNNGEINTGFKYTSGDGNKEVSSDTYFKFDKVDKLYPIDTVLYKVARDLNV